MKTAAAFLFLVLLALSTSASGIQGPRGIEKKISDATFVIYGSRTNDKGETEIAALCTATAFSKSALFGGTGYLLLTAGHCVAGEPADVVFSVAEDIGAVRFPVRPIMARLSDSEDIAIFFFQSSKKYPVIPLGDEGSERVGNTELNVNFTSGYAKQVGTGEVASAAIVKGEAGRCSAVCVGKFLVHLYGFEGASGSAVVSKKTHKIIGIAILAFEGEPVGMAIEPVSIVRQAMTESDQYAQIHQPSDDDDGQ